MKTEYTIGEISKLYNLGHDSLRYYEKKGLISPLRKENGYRSYTIDDIWRLNVIKDLRKLNFSITQIKAYLEQRTISSTIELMKKEIKLIDKEIAPLISLKKNLEYKLETIAKLNDIENIDTIIIKKLNPRKILFIDAPLNNDDEVDLAFRRLEGHDDNNLFLFANKDMGVLISDIGVKTSTFTLYHKAFFFVEEDSINYNMVIPEGEFLSLLYRGSYKQSQQLFEKAIVYISEQGYSLNGSPMEIYRLDIHGTSVESEFITEIQIPIKLNK